MLNILMAKAKPVAVSALKVIPHAGICGSVRNNRSQLSLLVRPSSLPLVPLAVVYHSTSSSEGTYFRMISPSSTRSLSQKNLTLICLAHLNEPVPCSSKRMEHLLSTPISNGTPQPMVQVAMSSASQVERAATGCFVQIHINQQAESLSKPIQPPVWLLPSGCSA